jgi:hypothetical protein
MKIKRSALKWVLLQQDGQFNLAVTLKNGCDGAVREIQDSSGRFIPHVLVDLPSLN